MSTPLETPAKPTSRQLAYIRDLNSRTGTNFNYPGTKGRARREIDRLTALAERQDTAIERFTKVCEDSGLPAADEVQRDGSAVRFLWTEQKLIVIVDLDELDGQPTDDDPAIAA